MTTDNKLSMNLVFILEKFFSVFSNLLGCILLVVFQFCTNIVHKTSTILIHCVLLMKVEEQVEEESDGSDDGKHQCFCFSCLFCFSS